MPYRSEYLPALIAIVISWVAAAIGRVLLDDRPLNWRRLSGEGILAIVGGVLMFAFGMMQNMELWQMIFFGILGGLGGVRAIEESIRAGRAILNSLKGG